LVRRLFKKIIHNKHVRIYTKKPYVFRLEQELTVHFWMRNVCFGITQP
jgi:hypothetical protein